VTSVDSTGGDILKRIVLTCLAILLMYSSVGCRIAGKAPEGLIKKDADELDKETELNSTLMIEENSDETNDNTNTVKQENISLYFWNKENNRLICETRNIITTDVGIK